MDTEKILVVGAHPDDVDFSTAGTMLQWVKENKDIFYLICTSGNKGGSSTSLTSGELVEVRRREQLAASSLIGAKEVIFLSRNDGELTPDQDLKRDITRVIRKIRPQKVFCFDPGNHKFDNFHLFHTDHRASGLATFDSVFPAASNRLYFPELLDEGLSPYRVPEMYFYGTNEPNIWIDISSVIDKKIEILKCHKSQFNKEKLTVMEERVKQRAKQAASDREFEYAEAFRVLSFLL
jgi:LmbE family N-acetylglucosaminyl deacetylase